MFFNKKKGDVCDTKNFERLIKEKDGILKKAQDEIDAFSKENKELKDVDHARSEFLSIAAHQLRTPLAGTKWTLNMILQGEFGKLTHDQSIFLKKSYESNERMIKLVEDMLHADRISAGRFDFNPSQTQVLDIINGVVGDVLPYATGRKIKIEFAHLDTDIPPVSIDQEKIRAVFQNLIDNAIKYVGDGGVVSIDVRRLPDALQFKISDNGIGIPEDQKQLIFSRFFRARNAVKMDNGGSGLGLFIVKSIIEMHGGKIWFESKEGKGTTFYFTIKI